MPSANPIGIGETITALVDVDVHAMLEDAAREQDIEPSSLALESLRALLANPTPSPIESLKGYAEPDTTHEELEMHATNVRGVSIELDPNDRLDLALTCMELEVNPQLVARLAVINAALT